MRRADLAGTFCQRWGQLAVACAGASHREEAETLCPEFAARGQPEYAAPTWLAMAKVAAADMNGGTRT